MIVEILSRLPVKSLIRFMSVSKSYSSLICSPQFTRIHTLRAPSKILITFMQIIVRHNIMFRDYLYGHRELYMLPAEHHLPLCGEISLNSLIKFEYPFPNIKIIGSCNGIFFLKYHDFLVQEFVLWNPSLRCKLTLPRINRGMIISGFGFDGITDDYKVLKMSYCLTDLVVYSIKTGAWAAIPPPTNNYPIIYSYFSCFVNGSMHWLVGNLNRDLIMTFDVSANVFGEIALPEEIEYYSNSLKLIIIRGRLAVVGYGIGMDECVVWMMGEYNNASTWSRFYQVKCDCWDVLQGCLETNGEIFMLFQSTKLVDSGFQIVNAVTGARSKLVELGVDNIIIDEVQTFNESLGLLNVGLHC